MAQPIIEGASWKSALLLPLQPPNMPNSEPTFKANTEEDIRAVTVGNGKNKHILYTVVSDELSLSRCATRNQRKKSESDITCFRCGETGHKKQDCLTWKTKMCPSGNQCKTSVCPFAHSMRELRDPWTPKCIRIVRQGGTLVRIGCGCVGHTYRNCPNNHK